MTINTKSSKSNLESSKAGMPLPQNRFPENLPTGWRNLLKGEADEPYFRELTSFLRKRYQSGRRIYPARDSILRALQLVDYPDVKVVILGQDPYHGAGQAMGLCF